MIDVGKLERGNSTSVRVLLLIENPCKVQVHVNRFNYPHSVTWLFLHSDDDHNQHTVQSGFKTMPNFK